MRSAAILTIGTGLLFKYSEENVHAWAYRDDIGAFWGIKGYEEMVSEVGTHHGHLDWP
jgi:ubiquinol-cytochrome c reductase cytochrome c1 subunit